LISWIERTAKRQGKADRSALLLDYPGMGFVARVAIRPGGVLQRLRSPSVALERHYGWQSAQAVAFVVTDSIPIVSILRTTLHHDSPRGPRVILDIDPDLVLREYRRARAELLRPRVQPAQPHTLEATLARFDSRRQLADRLERVEGEEPDSSNQVVASVPNRSA
jgi:hypothetical protein